MPHSPLTRRAVAIVAAAALTGYFAALVSFDPTHDESWMVLVTIRIAQGDRLYQDVFCGVTPLAFQLQWAIQSVFGASIAVLRGLSFVLYALSAVVVLATGLTLRLSRFQLAFLLAATLIWTVPENSSTYNPWAVLFALGAQYCALRSIRSLDFARWAAAAGIGCGLAFAAKQNIGLLCFAALMVGLAISRPCHRGRVLSAAATTFVLAAAIPILPVVFAGGTSDLLNFGLFNKTVYTQVAALSYSGYLHLTPLALWQQFGFRAGTLEWGRALLYLAPIFLLAAWLGASKLLVPRHSALRMQLVFSIAALGFVYPRPDGVHMALCAPFVALSLASVLRLAIPNPRFCRWTAWSFGAILVLQFAAWGSMLLHPLPATVSGVKAFQGLRVLPEFAAFAESATTRLPAEQHGSRGIFVLHPGAATIYLAAGISNPTPHDYPLNSAFGPKGQQQLIQQLRAGLIPAVCLPDQLWTTNPFWRPFTPMQLLNYVRTEMKPGPELPICRMYLPR